GFIPAGTRGKAAGEWPALTDPHHWERGREEEVAAASEAAGGCRSPGVRAGGRAGECDHAWRVAGGGVRGRGGGPPHGGSLQAERPVGAGGRGAGFGVQPEV